MPSQLFVGKLPVLKGFKMFHFFTIHDGLAIISLLVPFMWTHGYFSGRSRGYAISLQEFRRRL
jgi:hypothetical protein